MKKLRTLLLAVPLAVALAGCIDPQAPRLPETGEEQQDTSRDIKRG